MGEYIGWVRMWLHCTLWQHVTGSTVWQGRVTALYCETCGRLFWIEPPKYY